MVGVELTGLDKLMANANGLANDLADLNEKATIENLKDLKEQAILRAPYKTGTLKRSIDYRMVEKSKDQVIGVCGSNLPYALIQEVGGTIPAHTIEAKNRKVLYSKDTDTFFGPSVTIPAIHIRPQPYLFPSLVEGIERFLGRYRAAWAVAGKKGL